MKKHKKSNYYNNNKINIPNEQLNKDNTMKNKSKLKLSQMYDQNKETANNNSLLENYNLNHFHQDTVQNLHELGKKQKKKEIKRKFIDNISTLIDKLSENSVNSSTESFQIRSALTDYKSSDFNICSQIEKLESENSNIKNEIENYQKNRDNQMSNFSSKTDPNSSNKLFNEIYTKCMLDKLGNLKVHNLELKNEIKNRSTIRKKVEDILKKYITEFESIISDIDKEEELINNISSENNPIIKKNQRNFELKHNFEEYWNTSKDDIVKNN